jgi:hypothetical protein
MVTGGWQVFGPHPEIAAWAAAALPLAIAALRDQPLRAGGTWAVGLDLLKNDAEGAVAGVPLPWHLLPLAPEPLHRAQLSAVYPGYPQPDAQESQAAAAFRRNRDAAHLDGLLPIGPDKRRMIREPHHWILGLPLTRCSADASPLVVWEGSHLLLGSAMAAALAPHPEEQWPEVDVTEIYQATRAEIFRTCARVETPLVPGQAVLLHRHLLHGVAPWGARAVAPPEGRIIAYFRPLLSTTGAWAKLA